MSRRRLECASARTHENPLTVPIQTACVKRTSSRYVQVKRPRRRDKKKKNYIYSANTYCKLPGGKDVLRFNFVDLKLSRDLVKIENCVDLGRTSFAHRLSLFPPFFVRQSSVVTFLGRCIVAYRPFA